MGYKPRRESGAHVCSLNKPKRLASWGVTEASWGNAAAHERTCVLVGAARFFVRWDASPANLGTP